MKKGARDEFCIYFSRNDSEVFRSTEQYRVSKGLYKLMTKTRQKVVGRNKQLDKGAGGHTWKCLDPLNCVASVAFRKHDT